MIAAVSLPRFVLERVERVRQYHAASRLSPGNVRRMLAPAGEGSRRDPFRIFGQYPRTPLPTTLLDVSAPTMLLLRDGIESVPESQLQPPQDLKTLATWLFLADGLVQPKENGRGPAQNGAHQTTSGVRPVRANPANGAAGASGLRTCPSSGACYPYEIYVAAIGMSDLPAGLYHYSPREFSLRKLREGGETLSQLKKGRPEFEFLKDCPAALLVSTIFSRSAWRFRTRGYRYALLDAGHLIENIIAAGHGLGMELITRLRLNDSALGELIGVSKETDFNQAEAVQAMIAWADRRVGASVLGIKRKNGQSASDGPGALSDRMRPDEGGIPETLWGTLAASAAKPDAPGDAAVGDAAPVSPFADAGRAAGAVNIAANVTPDRAMRWDAAPELGLSRAEATGLPLIVRDPLSSVMLSYGSILAAHQDCVESGVPVRDIRPPLTELSPLPIGFPSQSTRPRGEREPGQSLRNVLMNRRSCTDLLQDPMPVDVFYSLNRIAFRGGTFTPLLPAGPHVALIRPFWIAQAVSGMEQGVWFYHPANDSWSLLRGGLFRNDTRRICIDQEICRNAAAVCFMAVNLQALMARAGPDIYRLAHLEAGVAAQRLALGAASLGFAASGIAAFYDEEVRQFFGLANTGWEFIYGVAMGVCASDGAENKETDLDEAGSDWRG